jgi:hypothetical protein
MLTAVAAETAKQARSHLDQSFSKIKVRVTDLIVAESAPKRILSRDDGKVVLGSLRPGLATLQLSKVTEVTVPDQVVIVV